jgi:hypothetical protein
MGGVNMKVTETHDIGTGYDEYAGKGSVDITLTNSAGERIAGVTISAGEPEDATFNRDLSGAYDIANLIGAAYKAGVNGEAFDYEFIDERAEGDE